MTGAVMLKTAIEQSGKPPKEIAIETNYSVDAIYAACQGKRRIPQDAKQKLANISLLAGLAIALEDTGYSIFEYLEGDRHPQTLLRIVEKEEHEAEEALKGIGWRTIDKNSGKDLTPEDETAMRNAAKELIEAVRADINLLIDWDTRYPQLGIRDMFRQKNRPL